MPYHRHPHRHPTPPPDPSPAPVPSPLPDPPPAPATPTPAPPGGYAFADEFDGAAGSPPDPSKWTYDLGGGGWGNGELETYVSDTAHAYQDGQSNLVIAATYTDGVYESARIKTQGLFSQQAGHFEARIKVNSQPGIWPAFWMMGQDISSGVNWPQCGEVDILEDYGKTPQIIESTVHTPDGTSTYSQYTDIASDDDWHIYRLDWEETTFTFNRDGTSYLTVTESEFPSSSWVYGPATPNNGGMFFLLNVAIGGFAGTPNPASWPVELLVDYVHAWQ